MRLDGLERLASRRRMDQVLVMDQANIRALTGVNCDNAVLELARRGRSGGWRAALYTDFRYAPMVHRVAPDLACRDIRRLRPSGARIGYESSIPHSKFLELAKKAPRAKFVDVSKGVAELRAVKTPEEQERIRAAERLDCEIWLEASSRFKAGMTEREMARTIQRMMIDRGEGEAFSTIVCVGRNAAECHHEPDDTVWNGRECVLVDMGVKLDGVCSDLTRNLVVRPSRLYRKVYGVVREANRAAIAAARPGVTCRALDRVARGVIAKAGFGKCFGHSLGHGVGYRVHEAPQVSRRSDAVLKSGMVVTIEPGIYLEGNLGVRIEDLVLITEDGCEVLSSGA
ncbi:MAG: aminopeptidase P family protein [Kiritimatiellae bacterium]|nr:aminopeptidase P family protein [Kiritimatiellia bacterium]